MSIHPDSWCQRKEQIWRNLPFVSDQDAKADPARDLTCEIFPETILKRAMGYAGAQAGGEAHAMTSHTLETHSQLFTVRLWREELGAGETEWRGQVTHVLSGEAHYFRCWDQLGRHLEVMAGRDAPEAPEPGRTVEKTVCAE